MAIVIEATALRPEDFGQSSPSVDDLTTPADSSQLLNLIADAESNSNPNVVYGGKEQPLTQMTVKQVRELQDRMVNEGAPSSAAGKYQIIRGTLDDLTKRMGLSGDELFTEELQDRMAQELLNDSGWNKLQANNIDEETFMHELSKEWASLPKDSGGKSYYAGDGLNKALVSPEKTLAAIRSARGRTVQRAAVRNPLVIEAQAITEEDFKQGFDVRPSQKLASQRGGTLSKAIRRGWAQSGGLYGQFIRELGQEYGFPSLMEVGDEMAEKAFVEAVRNPAPLTPEDDFWSLSTAGTFVANAVGEQIPNLAYLATGAALVVGTRGLALKGIAAAFIRAGIGKAAARQLAMRAIPSTKFAAGLGAYGSFLPLNTGEVIQEQRDAGLEPTFGSSLAVGVPVTMLDMIGVGAMVKTFFGRKTSKEAAMGAINLVLRRMGFGSLTALMAEGGTELTQEAMIIASRKLKDPTFSINDAIMSSEGLRRLAFAGLSGAAVGGVFGGLGGATRGTIEAARVKAAEIRESTARLRRSVETELSAEETDADGNTSIFGFDVLKRKVIKEVSGVFDSIGTAVDARRNTELAPEEQEAANVAAHQAVSETLRLLNDELKATSLALGRLRTIRTQASDTINKILRRLGEAPKAETLTPEQNAAVRKARDRIKTVLDNLKNLPTEEKLKRVPEALDVIQEQVMKVLEDPLKVPTARVRTLVRAVSKVLDETFDKKIKAGESVRKTINSLQARLNQAVSKKLTPAKPEQAGPVTTPVKDIAASLQAVAKRQQKRVAFAVGRTVEEVEKLVGKWLKRYPDLRVWQEKDGRTVVTHKDDMPHDIEDINLEVGDGFDSYRQKAAEDFEVHGVSDRDRAVKVKALRKNVGKEASEAYDSTYQKLVDRAVAERMAARTDVEALEYEKKLDEIENPLVIQAINKDGDQAGMEVVDQTDLANVSRVTAKLRKQAGPGGTVEVVQPHEEATRQVALRNEELRDLDQLDFDRPETQNRAHVADSNTRLELSDNEEEIFVRMYDYSRRAVNDNRLYHAELDIEGNIKREDGKPFRLFSSIEQATKAFSKVDSRTAYKLWGSVNPDVVEVKLPNGVKGYVIRVQLRDGKTRAAEKQLRKAEERGKEHTPDPNKRIEALRPNNKTTRFHAGDITLLGMALDVGSTQNVQRGIRSNPQAMFLAGLAYINDRVMRDADGNVVTWPQVIPDGKLLPSQKKLPSQKPSTKPTTKFVVEASSPVGLYYIDFRPVKQVVDGKTIIKANPADANKVIFGNQTFIQAKPDPKRAVPTRYDPRIDDQTEVHSLAEARRRPKTKSLPRIGTRLIEDQPKKGQLSLFESSELSGLPYAEWIVDEARAGNVPVNQAISVLWGYGLWDTKEIAQLLDEEQDTVTESARTQSHLSLLRLEKHLENIPKDEVTAEHKKLLKEVRQEIKDMEESGELMSVETAERLNRVAFPAQHDPNPSQMQRQTINETLKSGRVVTGTRLGSDEVEGGRDITDETLALPSYEAYPEYGDEGNELGGVPHVFKKGSLRSLALGYATAHKDGGARLINYIWRQPTAEKVTKWLMDRLNIKEQVVLFDEDSATLLQQIYNIEANDPNNSAERTELYKNYRDFIAETIEKRKIGRTHSTPQMKGVPIDEHVIHIFVSKSQTRIGETRAHSFPQTLGHELGHVVEKIYFNRLAVQNPELAEKILSAFNKSPYIKKLGFEQGRREAFADYMSKVAVDMHYGRKTRVNTDVENFFAQIVSTLKELWETIYRTFKKDGDYSFKYPKTFGEFVDALHTHTARQRGEKAPTPEGDLAKEILAELDKMSGSGAFHYDSFAGQKSQRTKPVPQKQTGKIINIWHGKGQNSILSNLAHRPFKWVSTADYGSVDALEGYLEDRKVLLHKYKSGQLDRGEDTGAIMLELEQEIKELEAQLEGKYESVEHAYQTNKSGSFDYETYKKNWKGGNKKIPGNKRVNHKISRSLMYDLISASLEQNPKAKEYLRATLGATLTHKGGRADFWTKAFPEILMEVRSHLFSPQENEQLFAAWEPLTETSQLTAEEEAQVERQAHINSAIKLRNLREWIKVLPRVIKNESGTNTKEEIAHAKNLLREAKKQLAALEKKASKTPEYDALPAPTPGKPTMTYAGVGARATPAAMLVQMKKAAEMLRKAGYTLLSGGAKGADSAFEAGAGNQKDIFYAKDATDRTRKIAKEMHPAPGYLKGYVLNLMARNTNQIFGRNLDTPVDFVLAWTPDGAETTTTRKTGGTGQAIRMAVAKGIPVINMNKPGWEARLQEVLTKNDEAGLAEREAKQDETFSDAEIDKLEAQEHVTKQAKKLRAEVVAAEEKVASIQKELNDIEGSADDIQPGDATDRRWQAKRKEQIKAEREYDKANDAYSKYLDDNNLTPESITDDMPTDRPSRSKLLEWFNKGRQRRKKLVEERKRNQEKHKARLIPQKDWWKNAPEGKLLDLNDKKIQDILKQHDFWELVGPPRENFKSRSRDIAERLVHSMLVTRSEFLAAALKARRILDNPRYKSGEITFDEIKQQDLRWLLRDIIDKRVTKGDYNDLVTSIVETMPDWWDRAKDHYDKMFVETAYEKAVNDQISGSSRNKISAEERANNIWAQAEKKRKKPTIDDIVGDAAAELYGAEAEFARDNPEDFREPTAQEYTEALAREIGYQAEKQGVEISEDQLVEAIYNEALTDEQIADLDSITDDMPMDANVDEAVERTQDEVFRKYVNDMKGLGDAFVKNPLLAVKMLLYPSNSELISMGSPIIERIAKKFHAIPGSTDDSRTVFTLIRQNEARFMSALKKILSKDGPLPEAHIPLHEVFLYSISRDKRKISQATRERIKQRKRLMDVLLKQTPTDQIPADLQEKVSIIRSYFTALHTWLTTPLGQEVTIDFGKDYGGKQKVKGMGLNIGFREFYAPLMIDTHQVANRREEFMKILQKHNFSENDADGIRASMERDENGGLNNGFQTDQETGEGLATVNFFGPGFANVAHRSKNWTDALRNDLIDAGFYQADLTNMLVNYTNLAVRRATWQKEFGEHNVTPEVARRYQRLNDRIGQKVVNIFSPVAKLEYDVWKAYADGQINEWQRERILGDILPGYAGQLGFKTNSKIRNIQAWAVIFENILLLPFAIFSQFVDVGTIFARGDWQAHRAGLRGILDKASRAEAFQMLEHLGAIRLGVFEHALNDQAISTFYTSTAKRINDAFFRVNMMEGWTNMMRAMALMSAREFIQRNGRLAEEGDALALKKISELGLTVNDVKAWDGHSLNFDTDTKIKAAVNRYIDEGMIRPSPAMRPTWMNDPGYLIFSHLKTFLYGFHETFLRRVGREARIHHNLLPLLTLMLVTLPLAAIGYDLRRKLTGRQGGPEGVDYAQELFERAGLFGVFQLVMDMQQADQYGKPAALALAGPTVEHLYTFLTTDDKDIVMAKSIPIVAQVPAMREWVKQQDLLGD